MVCAAGAQQRSAGNFDYYVLSLSWAPDFCAQPSGYKDPRECGKGRRLGFVVHGLWPQSERGRGPERCAPASPVRRDIVQAMLAYIPSPGLIQHEWSLHGVCSGLGAADYFGLVGKARDQIRIPPELQAPDKARELSPSEIEEKLAGANPRFPRDAFRTACSGGTLQEVRVCLTKDLAPRPCSASVSECRVSRMLIHPVQ